MNDSSTRARQLNLIDLAIEHHRSGRLDEASELYRRILQRQPDHLDALHLLGTIAYHRGEDARATGLFGRAIAIDATHPEVHYHLGLSLLRQGRLSQAAARFRRATKQSPSFAHAHDNLGTTLRLQGRPEEAISSHRRAVAIDPGAAVAHFHLGEALRDRGDLAEAESCFDRASELAPGFAAAVVARAEALLALGRPIEAVPLFQSALASSPDLATLHRGLGDARHALGDLDAAVAAYRCAVALDPSCVAGWWGLGCALSTQGEYAAAAESLRRAVALAPDSVEARHNLGQVLFELGQIDPALDAFREAATLRPNELTLGMIATIIPGSPRSDDRAVREARGAWAAACTPPDSPARPVRHAPTPGVLPLRVGYVSAFFHRRNWMKPVWGLINEHNRDRFEIHLFSDAPESGLAHGYRRHPRDRFHDTSGLAVADVARLIEAQGIDLLVDLNGYSRPSRLGVFARRPAPVLVAWFNTFAPPGMDPFDLIIGDPHVIPPDEEAEYGAPIGRVAGSYLTFEVGYPVPDVAPAPGLTRGCVTFGCLAPQYKITSEVVDAWSRILLGSPGSRLILKNAVLGSADNRAFVRGLFARSGISEDRVELDGPAEHHTFLEKYAEIDIALDTFPYNGGTTTMEAIWQGVPVLTFVGDRWASRISASLLRNAAMSEFVAPDLEGYVRTAIDMANDPDILAQLDARRRTMRDRLRRSSVCDLRSFAAEMEQHYLQLWQRGRQAVPSQWAGLDDPLPHNGG